MVQCYDENDIESWQLHSFRADTCEFLSSQRILTEVIFNFCWKVLKTQPKTGYFERFNQQIGLIESRFIFQ